MCLQPGRRPFKLGLILFCHKRLAGLPLMSGEGVDPPQTLAALCAAILLAKASDNDQPSRHVLRWLATEKKCQNVSCYWIWLQPCAARLTLPSLTSALCNSAEMFQGAPGRGRWTLVTCVEEVWACERARFMSACLPSTCHRDLLLLFTSTSAAHTLIWLPDERVTQSLQV